MFFVTKLRDIKNDLQIIQASLLKISTICAQNYVCFQLFYLCLLNNADININL